MTTETMFRFAYSSLSAVPCGWGLVFDSRIYSPNISTILAIDNPVGRWYENFSDSLIVNWSLLCVVNEGKIPSKDINNHRNYEIVTERTF